MRCLYKEVEVATHKIEEVLGTKLMSPSDEMRNADSTHFKKCTCNNITTPYRLSPTTKATLEQQEHCIDEEDLYYGPHVHNLCLFSKQMFRHNHCLQHQSTQF